jgi:LysR family cys regulon transcriptional activator
MEKLNIFNYKRNRLQQMKGFYYVARFGSVSEAAKAMNLTQSTVTLQVQSLERDLDLKLLCRDSKPMSLTKDGEEFYKVACPLIHQFESVLEKFLDSRKKKAQNKIDIAVHHIAVSYLMPQIINFFAKSHSDAKVVIRNIGPNEAMKRLKDGDIDLAFYPNAPFDPELQSIDTVAYDPVLIMNKKHPLAKKAIKSLKDLKDFNLIRIDQNLITLPLFEEAVKNYELGGAVEFENGNWEMLKHFVKKNDFVAIVSELCLDKGDDDLIVKNLADFFPKMSYSILHKKGELLKPIVDNFIEAINVVAKEFIANKL